MSSALLVLLGALLGATLNRASGDDRWMALVRLRGRPLYYTAPAIGGLALIPHTWPTALAIGASYLVWRLGAWGRWFDLGRLPDGYAREGVPLDPLESLIETLAGGSDHVALLYRHTLGLAPGALLVSLVAGDATALAWFVPLALAIVGAYELAWRIHEARRAIPPILVAELATGALWGAGIVLL